MSLLMCYLACEKELDGKPFTVCEVSTWYWIECHMAKKELSKKKWKEQMTRLYDLFHIGNDKTERGVTLSELKELDHKSNGGIRILPKTKEDLIRIKDWR